MSLLTKALVVLLFFSVLMGVVAFLPDFVMPDIIRTSLEFIIAQSFWTNRYLPVDTAIQIEGSVLATLFVLWIWNNGKRILNYLARVFA